MPGPPVVLREPGAPDWRAAAIASDAYTSPDRLARERTHVFARTWQLAGRLDQLPAPGDFFTVDLAGEPILVVHAGDAGIRAFYNVCRHRGRELVAATDCGRGAQAFRCSYHGWTYGLDGRVHAVPAAESFPDLDRATSGLVPVRCEVWQGLVFVHLDPAAEPLGAWLDVLPECLDRAFVPGVLVGLHRREFAVNWKTMLEAFIETHHIATLHPQVAKALLYQEASVAHFRRHSMTVVPAARASRWDERRTQSWRAWLEDPAYLEYHYTIFPNVSVHVFLWGLTFLFRCLPHARDPERMTMDVWIWKRIAEGETPPEPLSMPNAMQMILDQDYGNVELVQRGMRSRAFDHPRLSAFESRIGHLHAVLDGYLDGRGA